MLHFLGSTSGLTNHIFIFPLFERACRIHQPSTRSDTLQGIPQNSDLPLMEIFDITRC